ncbi:biopolymer transporter ExbD [Akkermansiaceae bacterium]|jgi:biopolymer transport protein ExbD|nr:biopolymer transporter ExbD [Akkermansiaceae bacterium]MDA7934482.1 biopolymer transporter ExbD [Akkermansiaceae bacterium]MDA9829892.1 biopolymer transporter ExbD [Akkermansiaceae bacterium]MDB4370101.1 biopolymer transporter ExbD [Akkermansiaceae bacterium]
MRIRDNSPPPASFQLAPMIDIVFLLLIFFLVTYQITEQEKDLKVAVPTTSEGSQKARVANKIVINLSVDGEITISGEVYTKDQLRQKLERIVKAAELANEGGADQQPVRIRADRDGRNQQLLELVDEIQKAGIWNIDFATRSPKTP